MSISFANPKLTETVSFSGNKRLLLGDSPTTYQYAVTSSGITTGSFVSLHKTTKTTEDGDTIYKCERIQDGYSGKAAGVVISKTDCFHQTIPGCAVVSILFEGMATLCNKWKGKTLQRGYSIGVSTDSGNGKVVFWVENEPLTLPGNANVPVDCLMKAIVLDNTGPNQDWVKVRVQGIY